MTSKIFKVLISAGLLVTLTTPHTQAAVSPQCASLETKRQKLHSDYQAKINPLAQLRIKNTYMNSQVSGELKTKLGAIHAKGDKERAVIFEKLRSKAVTAAQKTAMDTYKTEYNTALQALRAAQDTSQKSYIDTHNNLFASHRSAVDGQIVSLKNKFNIAFDKAVAQCAKIGLDKASAQLKSDIVLAQNDFNQTANVNLASVQVSLQPIAENHRAANETAQQAFHETIRASDIKLKAALTGVKYIFE